MPDGFIEFVEESSKLRKLLKKLGYKASKK